MTGIEAARKIIQNDFAVVVEASVKSFDNWQEAWEWVASLNNVDELPTRKYID